MPNKTKPGKKTAKKPNHKSPDAAAKRDANDAKIHALLQRADAKEGVKRERLVELSKIDPTSVKASLNRLIKASKAHSTGKTIDVKYFLGPAQKMAKKKPLKSSGTLAHSIASTPAKRPAREKKGSTEGE